MKPFKYGNTVRYINNYPKDIKIPYDNIQQYKKQFM